MNRAPMKLATAKRAPMMRVSEQLGFYIFAGTLLPAAIWATLRGIPLDEPLAQRTLIQSGLANLACWYSLDKLRTYARSRLLSYVLPVNLVLFGGVLAVNAFLRTSFSLSLFLVCASATMATSFLVTLRVRHANPSLRHYVVPGGAIGQTLIRQGFEVLRSADQLDALIDNGEITGSIIADLHHDQPAQWERLIAKAALREIPVYHYRLIEEALTGEVRIDHLRENDLGSLIPNLPYRTAKRAFDIAAVVLLAPFLLPLSGLIAVAIKLDSAGPVFFVQDRVGHRGEIFRMYKFRTMRERSVSGDAEARRDDAITKDGDDRITRIGRYLRKIRLDELPQAWHVLVGEMSWIGPRPEARELAQWYEEQIPFYAYRHIVRPGITGWAQVNQGHVAEIDEVQTKLRLDFYYVKNLSLWLDVLIALKTLRVIVQGIGAK